MTEPMTYTPSSQRYDDMTYRRIGHSGLLLPIISLGLWHNFGEDTSLDSQRRMLRCAFDAGITHFDLANNYGHPTGRPSATSAGFSTAILFGTATSS